MASGEEEGKPSLTSVHVEFVPRHSGRANRGIDTYADPGRTLRDVIATIVAETYPPTTSMDNSSFENYVVYINRPRDTPFFPIAANEDQIKAFNRSLAHPPHKQVPDSMLAMSLDIVVKNYGISIFTVYEAAPPSKIDTSFIGGSGDRHRL